LNAGTPGNPAILAEGLKSQEICSKKTQKSEEEAIGRMTDAEDGKGTEKRRPRGQDQKTDRKASQNHYGE
jgi:hypothetical protein